MSVPKEIVVEYVDEPKGTPYFRVTGVGLVWGRRTFGSLAALSAWLSRHDYRHRIGNWFGLPGVWRRV